MRTRSLVVAIACGTAALVAVNCGRSRECASDSECPEGAYCNPTMGFCFARGGVGDGGQEDGGQDGGGDGGIVAQAPFCSSSRWCWESPTPTGAALLGVSSTAADDTWVAGYGVLMRFDGTVWTNYAASGPGFIELFNDVWARERTDAWAVGEEGITKRWNGRDWSSIPSGTSASLFDIFGFSASSVWAVGTSGTILRWDGAKWNAEVSNTTKDLYAIWGTTAEGLWAFGNQGVILRRTSSGWEPVPSPVTSDITGVCGTSASDLWAVGEEGILRGNGDAWTLEVPNIGSFFSATCKGPADVWLAGDRGFLHWDGTQWTENLLPGRVPLFGIGFAPDGTGWASGLDGTLVRWTGSEWEIATRRLFSGSTTALDVFGGSSILAATSDGRVVSCSSAGSCLETPATGGGPIVDLVQLAPPNVTSPNAYALSGTAILHELKRGELWSAVQLASEATVLSGRSDPDAGADLLWAVGPALVQHCGKASCSAPSDAGTAIFVAVAGLRDAALVSDGTMVLRCQPAGDCEDVPLPAPVNIQDMWSPDGLAAFAACAAGQVLRWTGSEWFVDQLPTTANLTSIHGSSATDVWVAGAGGALFRFNGSTWSPVASGTSQTITRVRSMSPNAAAALVSPVVPGPPAILRYRP